MDFHPVTCKVNISDLRIQGTQIFRRNHPISSRYIVPKKGMKMSATQNHQKTVLFGHKNVDNFATNEDFCEIFFDTFR